MDLGAIFLILSGLLLVVIFITRPFMDHRVESAELLEQITTDQEDHRRSAWLAERERILANIQELDFDFALGKIPAEDYPPQREQLVQNGIAVLKKLDELDKEQSNEAAEYRLEEAIAARRAVASLVGATGDAETQQPSARRADATARLRLPPSSSDDLEALIAARRQARQEKSAGFCPQCGKPVMVSDRFCSNCGTPVAVR